MKDQDYILTSTEALQSITAEQAWHYRIIPSKVSQNTLECFSDEQYSSIDLVDELEIVFGKKVLLEPTNTNWIEHNLSRLYIKGNNEKQNIGQPIVDLEAEDFVIQLIAEAKQLNSSDIHIEIYEENCRVRMRIDGLLVERYLLKKDEYPSLVNKIKIMAHLDIAEKRLPQDGRIFYHQPTNKFDIRVSVLPTLHGEKIVLRILGNDASDIDIHQLGFTDFDLANYMEGIKQPNGILLISGPTGSGKTTTLYATLKLLNKEKSNILTIEDPIEYTLEGINQVQLKESIGLDFAKALRTFLRQDPDIIMVGEIRDQNTANMAVRAALTGHLVLSTIHTNSAWGTISRLIDMGVPAYLLANTLNTTVAQRLIRLLCPHCKVKEPFLTKYYPPGFHPFRKIEIHYTAQGCQKCYHTGYKGRKAIYEVIPIDAQLTEKIKNTTLDITEELKKRNIKTLAANAFELFENGDTTIEEIYSLLFNY